MIQCLLAMSAAIFGLVSAPASAQAAPTPAMRVTGRVPAPAASLNRRIAAIVARYDVVTAGVGVIRNGRLVWTGAFGAQAPGIPATIRTRFNVASITKTVAAETVLRLVAEGRLGLDEPLAPYWVDPQIADDPRHQRLTPRMLLTHRSGFPNWRFFRRDGRLAFEREPGTAFGYSGEGFEYLARAVERKLGTPFPDLVATHLLRPLGMRDTQLTVRRADVPGLARPVDEEGAFPGFYCRPGGSCRAEGSYSAADDMVTTVPDYARLLAAVSRHGGYSRGLTAERDTILPSTGPDATIDCAVDPITCPRAQGYGLGFVELDFGNTRVIGHGGSDWYEQALAYVHVPSGDGVIIFLNAPNRRALSAMPEVLALLDPASPFLPHYRRWLAREIAQENAAR